MRVAVIIPALDEQESVAHVIAGIPRDLVDEVVVVDNGSTDRTAEVSLLQERKWCGRSDGVTATPVPQV